MNNQDLKIFFSFGLLPIQIINRYIVYAASLYLWLQYIESITKFNLDRFTKTCGHLYPFYKQENYIKNKN